MLFQVDAVGSPGASDRDSEPRPVKHRDSLELLRGAPVREHNDSLTLGRAGSSLPSARREGAGPHLFS